MAASDTFEALDRRLRMQRWRARSRIIQFLRKALPALMATIALSLAGMVAWTSLNERPAPVREAQTPIRLVGARFVGRVDDGRSFTLGAREAVRDERNVHRATLIEPFITIGDETASPARLSARSGSYDEVERILRLEGDVRIDDGAGHRFASDEALVDTRTGEIKGNAEVVGDGPLGQVTAKSYSVQGKGDRLVFRGGVRARIEGD